MAEVKAGRRFTIQFGPVFNIMNLTFYRNGNKTIPGITEDSVQQKFNLIRPIYTISDNYSANADRSTRLWVGWQVSIFYNLYFFKPK